MTIRPVRKRKAVEYQNDVEKHQSAIRAVIARRNHLAARQKKIPVFKRAIGGKPVPKLDQKSDGSHRRKSN